MDCAFACAAAQNNPNLLAINYFMRRKPMKRKSFVFVLVLILALSLLAIPVGAKPSGTVNVQILALNDFHGNLSTAYE